MNIKPNFRYLAQASFCVQIYQGRDMESEIIF